MVQQCIELLSLGNTIQQKKEFRLAAVKEFNSHLGASQLPLDIMQENTSN